MMIPPALDLLARGAGAGGRGVELMCTILLLKAGFLRVDLESEAVGAGISTIVGTLLEVSPPPTKRLEKTTPTAPRRNERNY